MVCFNGILSCLKWCRNCRESCFLRHVPEQCCLTARLRSSSRSEPGGPVQATFASFPHTEHHFLSASRHAPLAFPGELCLPCPHSPSPHTTCAQAPFPFGNHRVAVLQSPLEPDAPPNRAVQTARRQRAKSPTWRPSPPQAEVNLPPSSARPREGTRCPRAPIRRRGSGLRRRRVTGGWRGGAAVAAHAQWGCRGFGARRSP